MTGEISIPDDVIEDIVNCDIESASLKLEHLKWSNIIKVAIGDRIKQFSENLNQNSLIRVEKISFGYYCSFEFNCYGRTFMISNILKPISL